jgi:hypothetical protein
MTKRETKSLLTEWLLKIAIIFYIADVLLNTGDNAVTEIGIHFTFIFIVKLIALLAILIILFATQKALFKNIGFLALIMAASYKLVMYVSRNDFVIAELINTASEFLIISFSIYYLYRVFKKKPRKKIESSRRRRAGKTS